MSDRDHLQAAHNEGQKVESQGGEDPFSAITRALAYDSDEKRAFEAGREHVRNQRDQQPE